MTGFIIGCAVMVTAALVWLLWPLARKSANSDATPSGAERGAVMAAIAVLVPALAITLYATLSNWNFNAVAQEAEQATEMNDLLAQLETKLRANPGDADGWLLLARSYATTGQFAGAARAYEQALTASNNENVDAMIGLAESLTLVDQNALTGRAGELLERALTKAPNHPKALWYGGLAALRSGELAKGRERLQQLLAQNPPEEIRSVIERQIADVDQQLGGGGEGAAAKPVVAQAEPKTTKPASDRAKPASDATATGPRTIKVNVSIAPDVQKKLTSALPLFVLARDPSGGPPLAAKRLTTAAAPLTIELSERDAMMPTRTIASTPRVQVVARVSKTGTPQAQSGDYFGDAEYDFGRGAQGEVKIVIDRAVP